MERGDWDQISIHAWHFLYMQVRQPASCENTLVRTGTNRDIRAATGGQRMLQDDRAPVAMRQRPAADRVLRARTQVARAFILHRIDFPSLGKLPGVPPRLVPSRAVGSNVHSVAESVLLIWATCHLIEGTGVEAARVSNFHSDFSDGVALACLLHAHWPPLSHLRAEVHDAPTHASEAEHNVAVVLRMLEAVHCALDIEARHLLRPDPAGVLFVLAYLCV